MKKKVVWLVSLFLLFFLGGLFLWGNLTVGTTYYKITSERLPVSFEGFKIAHISDLHNAEYGQNHSQLVDLLKKESPNTIVITGDLVDSYHTDINSAIRFIKQAVDIAPCYYVTGNHEARLGDAYNALEDQLISAGVIVLRNEVITLSHGDGSIQLIGLDDPNFSNGISSQVNLLDTQLQNMGLNDTFKLLLSHRPEAFNAYVANDIDLVLSGHAHGGQFRIPFIGGIVAPNQGFFPKYDAGEYHEGNTKMIVSRGIGNSIISVRINNRPELVIIQLHSL